MLLPWRRASSGSDVAVADVGEESADGADVAEVTADVADFSAVIGTVLRDMAKDMSKEPEKDL